MRGVRGWSWALASGLALGIAIFSLRCSPDGSGSDAGGGDSAPLDSGGFDAPDASVADANDDGSSDGSVDTGSDATTFACGSPPPTLLDGGRTMLLDYGHKSQIQSLFHVGDRVLSADGSNPVHWNLWNSASDTQIMHGDVNPSDAALFAMNGGLFVVPESATLDVHDASDGHLIFSESRTTYPRVSLAIDGSYVWAASATSLTAWSPSGTLLFTRSGDYSSATIFPAVGELRVAMGPAGQTTIERITTNGTSSITPSFTGTFAEWFADGDSFLALGSGVQRAYKFDGTLRGAFALQLTKWGATGDFLWNTNTSTFKVDVYQVGGPSQPVASFNASVSATATTGVKVLAIMEFGTGLTVVDLSGTTPVGQGYNVPVAFITRFASDTPQRFTVGTHTGVLFHVGTVNNPNATGELGCGAPLATAGTGGTTTGTKVAVGFTSHTLVFDLGSQPGSIVDSIPFGSSQLAMTAMGDVLAASAETADYQYMPDRTFNIYSLPSATVLQSFPDPNGGNLEQKMVVDFTLASGGSRLARVLATWGPGWTFERHVTDLYGANEIYADNGALATSSHQCAGGGIGSRDQRIYLSPDGTMAAFVNNCTMSGITSLVYKNGSLLNGLSGYVIGWIDNANVLVDVMHLNTFLIPTYSGAATEDMNAVTSATLPIPYVLDFDMATTGMVYSHANGSIYDVSNGNVAWAGPGAGAIGGPGVIYFEGASILQVMH